jgi:hypothetical protein
MSQPEEIPAEDPPDDTLISSPQIPNEDSSATILEATDVVEETPSLDADFLSALGDTIDEIPTYGENIHQDLAQRWLPILRKGLTKEIKEKLLKEYAIPGNCKLLRAPSLNPEISAAITEMTKARDKKIENHQQQLGLGITAVNKAMSLLFTGDDKHCKVQAIKLLSEGCRILSDLHFIDTQTRIKLITPSVDKSFLNIIQDVERDETLFGSKLSEKIKASKTIEKQGLQIKKGVINIKTPTPSTSQSSSRPRNQGNWTAPSRYHQPSNRGGRGAAHRTQAANNNRRTAPPALPPPAKPSSHAQQRVSARQ